MRIRLVLVAAATALLLLPAGASARKGLVPFSYSNGTGSVGVFETATNDKVGNVFPAAPEPSVIHSVALAPDESLGFASFTGSDVVAAIAPGGGGRPSGPVGMVAVDSNPTALAVSPDTSRVYVTNNGSNTVSVIDVATFSVITKVTVGTAPDGVAITPDGTAAYVTNNGSNTLSVIDTATNTVTDTIGVGAAPEGVVVAPNGSRAYVADSGSSVTVINTVTETVTDTVSVGTAPKGVAVTPDGSRAYVTNSGSGNVSVINTATNAVTDTIGVGTAPRGVDITASGAYVYVANQDSNSLSVIETAGNTVVATVATVYEAQVTPPPDPPIPIPVTAPKAIAIDDTTNEVWSPGAVSIAWNTIDSAILRINSDSASVNFNTVAGIWGGSISPRPMSAAITPDGKHAYAADTGGSSVTVLDTETNAVEATVPVGIEPRGIAVTPDGREAWVASSQPGGTGGISIIDTATNTVADTITGINGAIAFTPDGKQAYVAGQWTDPANSLKVVDTATRAVVKTLNVGTYASSVATSPDGKRAYVSNELFPGELPGTVKVIDTATNEIIDEIDPTPPGSFAYFPGAVAVSPDGQRLYVAAAVENEPPVISVFDTGTDSFIEAIPDVPCVSITSGSCGQGFAVTPDGTRAYFPSGNGLKPVDLGQGVVGSTISWSDGLFPSSVAIVPNQPPVAALQASTLRSAAAVEGTAGELTTFDATASTDSDGTIARYDWDFGDGTTVTDAGPTPSHTYQAAGTYTATVTETDNEGCSTDLVFTGQTAYCNGSSAARNSIQVNVADLGPGSGAGTPEECEAVLRSPLPSVSHWTSFQNKVRLRLKVEPGGYLLRSYKRGLFTMQAVKTKLGKRMRIRRVDFALDGERQKQDRKAPFTAAIDPGSLPVSAHVFKATAYTKQGKLRSRTLNFQISDCEAAAFSASMIGKLPRALTNVELRARTGGPELSTATFTLPRTLRMKTRRLTGKKIGTIRLTTKSGNQSAQSLRLTRRSTGAGRLLSSRKTGFDVSLKMRGTQRKVTVSGLKGKRVTGLSVLLGGKQTGLLRNPRTCQTHKFSAVLTSTSDQRLALDRSLKMCKSGKPK